jgi:hypothetical protein
MVHINARQMQNVRTLKENIIVHVILDTKAMVLPVLILMNVQLTIIIVIRHMPIVPIFQAALLAPVNQDFEAMVLIAWTSTNANFQPMTVRKKLRLA